ncbi:DUF3152 domain-containing protein [Streptomyces bathyalis]|uniref:DUF3152 domain-containing protein n=2 Tax=Streptomyces bathyalis TaxID=2710756 RepID=A0A7T1TCR0_9ACTN|nr:DUF3152 domain-containing protein [Streptomyces bathyalis]
MPGSSAGMGRPSGPRQDYVDAFDDDVFGKSATGATRAVRAPAPRHPGNGNGNSNGNGRPGGTGRTGPLPVRSPGGRRPGTPGPWNGYEGPPVFPQGRPTGAEPWQDPRETTADGLPRATPFVPAQVPRTEKGGKKGRVLLTGALAVAVTTVLAFVVAGQIAGSSQSGDEKAEGAGAERGLSTADGPASRSGKGRGVPGDAQGAAPTYTQKLAKTYKLDSGFKGKGKFDAVAGKAEGVGGSEVVRYRVDVEKGLPLDDSLFADAVHKTLNDKRSWAHGGERSFERAEKGNVDFVITLASSPTTDEWCAKSGLDTSVDKVSCDSASTDRVMINAYRWAQGSKTFGDDRMLAYRQMLINHEVGHRLGRDHVGCPKDGAPAPLMMQQTKSLTTEGRKCRPNPWPYPRG